MSFNSDGIKTFTFEFPSDDAKANFENNFRTLKDKISEF